MTLELGIDVIEPVAQEDHMRAGAYRLLARLLIAAPDETALRAIADLGGDETPFGKAITALAHLASRSQAQPRVVAQEFDDLFIGVGRGELVPYASYYLTGFLNEKPLARLRDDLARYGIERDPGINEPEDHVAMLFETMAGLIDGTFGPPLSLAEQKQFYDRHIGCWAGHFLKDLEAAKASVLYAAVGRVGQLFLEIEESAFRMG